MDVATADRNEGRWLERLEWNRSRLEDLARRVEGDSETERRQAEPLGRAQVLQLNLTNDAMLRVLVENQDQVERALERLREGRYGLCEDCDGEIGSERLLCRPEATRCMECQRRYERMTD